MSRTQQLAARAQGPLGVVLIVVAVGVLAGAWWAVGALGAFLLAAAVADSRERPDELERGEGGY